MTARARLRRAIASLLPVAALALGPEVHAAQAESATGRVVVRDDGGTTEPAGIVDVMRPALKVYRDRDGLPQNSAMALAFGGDGTLWVGTQDGIASFDGTSWTSTPLPQREISSFVRALLVDHRGGVWVGRQDGGLSCWRDGAWTTFDVADGLPSPRVDALLEVSAPGGAFTLWAGTHAGLARFDGGTWRAFEDNASLPSPRVTQVIEGTDDDGARILWVGTEAGLVKVRGPRATRVDGAPGARVNALLETADGDGGHTLWMGASQSGLGRRRRGSWSWTGAPALPTADVRSLAETRSPDGSRVLWVGTDNGIARLERGLWIPLIDDALPSRFAWSLAPQPSPGPTSDLWIGLDTGLARLHMGGFRSLDHTTGLPQDSVYALLVTAGTDGKDSLWVGMRGAGLARYDAGRWRHFGPADGFRAQTVFALAEHVEPDGSRSVYVGTQDAGLLRFDGTAFVSVEPRGSVRQMSQSVGDDGRPELWVTLAEGGLLHHVGEVWSRVDRASGAPFDAAFATLETREGDGRGERVLWVATQGSGLVRREHGVWSSFTRASGALLSDSVLSLLGVRGADGRAELWAGTEGGGVSRLDLDTAGAPFRTLTASTHPAIPNDTVYQLESDARGRVYLFTNKGVARLSPRAPTAEDDADVAVETFTTEDGLPANEFNGGAALVDGRGRIWAGTIAGATMLDPSRESPESDGQLHLWARTSAGGGRALRPGESLAYDESELGFDATLVSLFRGAETRYRTQLVGVDAAPGAFRREGHRELSSLAGGDYALRAWAQDYRGRVSGPVEIAFRVRPAPWLTVWAFALYAAAAALLVLGTVRVRVRAVERRNRELERGIAQRTRELRDKVSELAISEQRARAAEDEALRANGAKTTFLSTMSHELRTPLNAILGFAQLLSRDRTLSSESRESVEVVVKSGEHLLGLINDVLSITKIEAGKLVLDETTFVLSETIGAVEKMIRVRARSKRLSLQVEVRDGLPPHVRGDEGKVRQILLNLLGNAVKFTTEGGVAMRASWADGHAYFEVEDTGAGIASDDLARLFDPFTQTDAGRRAREGTGLGLFISRSYAVLMGGDITVQSELGRGTLFRVDLPLPVTEAAPKRASERRVVGLEPGQGPFRVLVVDDSPDNRAVLARLLDKIGGFDVREAASGGEAIQIFTDYRPHVTWMDLRMDGIDGIAATQAIRDREAAQGWPRSVILALSASAFDRDREWLLQSGCDAFIPKPYREAAIFEALGRHLGLRFVYEGDAPRAAPGATFAAARLSILPGEVRSSLRAAARAGDLRAARDAAARVAGLDSDLGASLREMIDAFRLEEIEAMLAPEGVAESKESVES
jgi:signal transduction histidine kinase/CheY-like chemotaxis protein